MICSSCALFLLGLFPDKSFSQGEFNNWYFGEFAGVCFNTGAPVALLDGPLNTGGESVTVSDSSGNLLFTSGGIVIYNKNQSVMLNSLGLWGGGGAFGQFQLSVQSLDDDSTYWFFSVGPQSVPVIFSHGLLYSKINMRLDGGLGGVEPGVKNIPVPGGASAYKGIAGTRHRNNHDVWVVVRLWEPFSHYYASYKITSLGIDTIPVLSYTPNVQLLFAPSGNPYIKISPDGTKLACTVLDGTGQFGIELCDFNPLTGVITPLFDIVPVNAGYFPTQPWSIEFSRDSRYLYTSCSGANIPISSQVLFQYDVSLPDSASIMQSETVIGVNPHQSALQLGPDWKIYGTQCFADSLCVINDPTMPGAACNYQLNAVSLAGNESLAGLPQFVQRYYVYVRHAGKCLNDTVNFSTVLWPPADSLHWDFGDPASGTNNESWSTNPFHKYSTPGTYTVTLIVRHIDKRFDTAYRQVEIYASPDPDLGPDQSVCIGDSATFDAGFCSICTYQWDNISAGQMNIGTGQTYTTGIAGTYRVTVTGEKGCQGSDTIQLSVITDLPVSVTIAADSNPVCAGASVTLTATPVNGGAAPVYQWIVNGVNVGNNQPTYTYVPSPLDLVSCLLTSSESCATGNPALSNPVTMIVNPHLPVSVSVSASPNPFCLGTPVTFTATPTNGGTLPVYQWQVNGISVGSNSPVYTYTPSPSDLVSCILTSSEVCTTGNPASSNVISMVENTSFPAGVSIAAPPNPFCPGTAGYFYRHSRQWRNHTRLSMESERGQCRD